MNLASRLIYLNIRVFFLNLSDSEIGSPTWDQFLVEATLEPRPRIALFPVGINGHSLSLNYRYRW